MGGIREDIKNIIKSPYFVVPYHYINMSSHGLSYITLGYIIYHPQPHVLVPNPSHWSPTPHIGHQSHVLAPNPMYCHNPIYWTSTPYMCHVRSCANKDIIIILLAPIPMYWSPTQCICPPFG